MHLNMAGVDLTFRLSGKTTLAASASTLRSDSLQADCIDWQERHSQQLGGRSSLLWPSGMVLLLLPLPSQLAEVQPFGVETKGLQSLSAELVASKCHCGTQQPGPLAFLLL